MPEAVATPKVNKLMRFFLLGAALLIVPIALNYGLFPAKSLPLFLTIPDLSTDQTHIYRGVMCLYLGVGLFWAVSAFVSEWQRVAVITVIGFAWSIAVGRVISLIVDGWPSPLLLIYLGIEIVAGLLGLAVLAAADRKLRR
ncbi:MAG: DUF4345 domain-containing protein [Methyloceanibacter sp.]|nr:DUF4345 domain-containing protein [Methyloceanibacter sp.]